MIILLLLALVCQSSQPPALELAETAMQLYEEGHYAEAAQVWARLLERLPHRGRSAYNLAAAHFMLDSLALADTVLTSELSEIEGDTLYSARSITSLALAIASEDYGGVESAVVELRSALSGGDAVESASVALEAGLNWLDNHEPPEDQQEQDQQEQDQDQEEQDQDQEEQDQDQEEQDQDQEEQDQDQDQQEQDQDQQEQDQDQQEQEAPPSIGEMSEEQAQAILDLVEDQQAPDSSGTGKAGYPAGPIW